MNGIKLLIVTCSMLAWSAAPAVVQTTLGANGTPVAQSPDGFAPESLFRDLLQVLGPTGFLAWYCYHVTSKALPKKDAQIERMIEKFSSQLQRERDGHKAIIDTVMAEHRVFTEKMTDTIMRVVGSCSHAEKAVGADS